MHHGTAWHGVYGNTVTNDGNVKVTIRFPLFSESWLTPQMFQFYYVLHGSTFKSRDVQFEPY